MLDNSFVWSKNHVCGGERIRTACRLSNLLQAFG